MMLDIQANEEGRVLGEDGAEYATAAEAVYYEATKFCGCGNPESIHEFLIGCLNARVDGDETIDLKSLETWVAGNVPAASKFILYFLDYARLTEHGGSVFYSWLTDLGHQFIEVGPDHEQH